jgi:transposase
LTDADTLAAGAIEWLKFGEEAGGNVAVTRLYGRAPAGERAVGRVPCHYGPPVTLLGALGLHGLEALMTRDSATDGAVFRAFVAQVFCPPLTPGDMVVMENLRAHQVAGIEDAITRCGARRMDLPRYAPDLSPSEPCWSQRKTGLRRVGARTREALEEAMPPALEGMTPADALAWFTHCGYVVT